VKPRLTITIGNYGLTKPLKSDMVRCDNLEYIQVDPITTAMRRMVRALEFDICEMAFATYLCSKAYGTPITAIPVFLTRNFHHRAIFYNIHSEIRSPKDLEGRVVGVNRGYTVTTGLWARGILESEYGVDLKKITWAPTDDEHVSEYQPPNNVDYSYRGEDLAGLLLAGKLDAAVGDLRIESPEVKPLIPNARNAGVSYFKKTGIYPINHGLVVKSEVLKSHPQLSRELFDAFSSSKRVYLDRLMGGKDLSATDEVTRELMADLGGDPFPFGVTANIRALEALLQFAVDQQVIRTKFTLEDIFAAGTLDFTEGQETT
jgi:4,5-dihydroxyphthalate decarboxylase